MSSQTISYYHIPVFTSPNSALFSTMRSSSPKALGSLSAVPTNRHYGSINTPITTFPWPSPAELPKLTTKQFLAELMTYNGDDFFCSVLPWFLVRVALLKILIPLVVFLVLGICILVFAEEDETKRIGFYLFFGSTIGLAAFALCFRMYMRYEMEAERKRADVEAVNAECLIGGLDSDPTFDADNEDEEMGAQEIIFAEDGEEIESDKWATMFSSG